MKKISLDELPEKSRGESYPEQYRRICAQIESGDITPVKSSPLNGKSLPSTQATGLWRRSRTMQRR